MRVRFWGVRGSHPVPGVQTNRYGGNTSCVQVLPDDGTVLVLDAGTGIRRLGKELMGGPLGRGEGTCHLLFSHTHWDHIQGLPFFAPLYTRGNRICVYARQREMHLREIFLSVTDDPYFPVSLVDVAAEFSYVELIEGASFPLGETRVRCALLNHPDIAIGYRFDADGQSVAYLSDTAPFDRILFRADQPAPPDPAPPSTADAVELRALRDGVVDLCRDCDLVIYDTMFRPEEYRCRVHWGHSTADHAVAIAEAAGARAVALYHYSPEITDDEVDAELARVAATTSLKVVAASEASVYQLGGERGVELADR